MFQSSYLSTNLDESLYWDRNECTSRLWEQWKCLVWASILLLLPIRISWISRWRLRSCQALKTKKRSHRWRSRAYLILHFLEGYLALPICRWQTVNLWTLHLNMSRTEPLDYELWWFCRLYKKLWLY